MATLLNWLQTTIADFVAGTCGSQILDTSGDELKLLPQDTKTQFNAGTYNNTGVGDDKNSERVQLLGIPNSDFEYNGGNLSQILNRWEMSGNVYLTTDLSRSGIYSVRFGGQSVSIFRYRIIDGISGTILTSGTFPVGSVWTRYQICDMSGYANKLIKLVIYNSNTGASICSPLFIPKSEILYCWTYVYPSGMLIDDLEGQECQLTGNFTSQTLDYANAPTDFGHLVYKGTIPIDTTLTFKTQSSADGTNWDAEVALGAGGTIDSTKKRYLRWKAYFTRTDDGKAIPYLESVYCGGAEWYSAKYNIGRLDSYQTFLSTYNKYTETLIISYRTARSSAELDTATWYLIDNNEVPVNGLKGLDIWIQLKVRFNTDTFANQPVLYDTKIQWYDMIDKGLRYGKDGINYPIGCMENPLGCKLRIRRNNIISGNETNGIILVDTTDPKASPIRIYINGQTKALAKYS